MHKRKNRNHTPDFEHKARTHFQKRWRERIGEELIPYDTLKKLMQTAARGHRVAFLEFISTQPPHSSRWRARHGGRDIVLAYDHAMKLPVSCWVDPPQETKLEAEVILDA